MEANIKFPDFVYKDGKIIARRIIGLPFEVYECYMYELVHKERDILRISKQLIKGDGGDGANIIVKITSLPNLIQPMCNNKEMVKFLEFTENWKPIFPNENEVKTETLGRILVSSSGASYISTVDTIDNSLFKTAYEYFRHSEAIGSVISLSQGMHSVLVSTDLDGISIDANNRRNPFRFIPSCDSDRSIGSKLIEYS